MHVQLKKQLATALVLSTMALIIHLFGQFPNAVLTYYSNGLYPYIGSILRSITILLPFAVGDVLYLFLIIIAFRAVFLFFKKLKSNIQKLRSGVLPFILLNLVLLCYIAFNLLWGLNYSRPPVNNQLGISNEKYSVKQLMQLAGYFIIKLNSIQPDRSVYYSIYTLEKEAVRSYQVLEKKNAVFRYSNPEIKSPLNNWLITRIGLEGYYNPFSGEANVNMKLPQFRLPFTACHEIAHQTGIAREDEANLIAYLTATNSSDVNFRYSAYYSVLRNILFELSFKSPEGFKKLYALLPAQVLADLKTDREFWLRYNNQLYLLMDAALDGYLKLNNQEAGIDSYQNIVLWVYNFHKEEL